MSTIVLRNVKGSALTFAEGDANFNNLNTDKVELTDLSVTQASASGTGTLSYNNATGVFTYTPPDLNNITGDINVTGTVVAQSTLNAQTGTTYTTVLADASKLVTLNNGSAITLTIPTNASVAYPVGTKIDLAQIGAGQVTVAGAGGVTVNSTPTLKFRAQYSAATCIKTATDTWLLVGDLADS